MCLPLSLFSDGFSFAIQMVKISLLSFYDKVTHTVNLLFNHHIFLDHLDYKNYMYLIGPEVWILCTTDLYIKTTCYLKERPIFKVAWWTAVQ